MPAEVSFPSAHVQIHAAQNKDSSHRFNFLWGPSPPFSKPPSRGVPIKSSKSLARRFGLSTPDPSVASLKDKHLVKETCVYNILFAACVRHSRVDMAAIFVGDMQAHNITLPKGMLVVLTRFLARHGQTDKAMELFKNWQEQHVAKSNSTSASSTHRLWVEIVHGYVVEGKLDKACAALEHAKRLKIKLDSKLYSALIGACTRKGNLLKALALLDEAHGVSSKENNAEQQQSPVQRALPPGEWLDLHPAGGFHSLISALAHRHGTEAADVVVRRHIEAGVPIDCLRLPFQTLEA